MRVGERALPLLLLLLLTVMVLVLGGEYMLCECEGEPIDFLVVAGLAVAIEGLEGPKPADVGLSRLCTVSYTNRFGGDPITMAMFMYSSGVVGIGLPCPAD